MQLSIFKYMFKIPDLRKRILFTIAMFGVYRLGASVPVPGVDLEAVQRLTDSGSKQVFMDFLIYSLVEH